MVLFQFILLTISSIKVYLEIYKPYFYDKKLAMIKLNVDIFKCSYFLASILTQLLDLDKKGFAIVIIISIVTVSSSINILNLKYKEKLIESMLNN